MFVVIVQVIESVEESFLGLIFTLEELNVIHQQNIDVSILCLELRSLVVLNCVYKVVGEFFAGDVANLGSWLQVHGVVTNCME